MRGQTVSISTSKVKEDNDMITVHVSLDGYSILHAGTSNDELDDSCDN